VEIGAEAPAEFATSTMSPVHGDHDYICSSRTSQMATAASSELEQGRRGTPKTTASRELKTFWKVGHDSRRKLCIVGFNWNTSQLRLSKLEAAKADSESSADASMKSRDQSPKSKVALSPLEAATPRPVSGEKPEVVNESGVAGAKRRSKVYIYTPTTSADCPAVRSSTAKSVALVNKPSAGKTGTGNSPTFSAEDETKAAVESIIPSIDVETTQATSAPPTLTRIIDDYNVVALSSPPAVAVAKKTSPTDYGYLSSLLRETGNGNVNARRDAASAAAKIIKGGCGGGNSGQTPNSGSTAFIGIPSPFLLQV